MEDKKTLLGRVDAGGKKGVDREDGPGRQKQNEWAEIAHEADTSQDGRDEQVEAEIHPLPHVPELSPKPEKLKN